MKTVDLSDRLKKCVQEDIESQPLYIDVADECIKCNWCPSWGGSQEVKRINQHCKRDKSHSKARMKLMGKDEDSTSHGTQDIRKFFKHD